MTAIQLTAATVVTAGASRLFAFLRLGAASVLLTLLVGYPYTAQAGQTIDVYDCSVLYGLHPFQSTTTCRGNLYAWAEPGIAASAGFSHIRRTVSPFEEWSFSAVFNSSIYYTSGRKEMNSLWEVLATGFRGYFELSWDNSLPAHSLTVINGSQYQSYSDLRATITPASCSQKSDGSGECFGDFQSFRQHTSPSTFAEFSQTIRAGCRPGVFCFGNTTFVEYGFSAQIGNNAFHCEPVDESIRGLWTQALLNRQTLWVSWDSNGHCDFLMLDNEAQALRAAP